MSYRRVRKESDKSGRSLWSAISCQRKWLKLSFSSVWTLVELRRAQLRSKKETKVKLGSKIFDAYQHNDRNLSESAIHRENPKLTSSNYTYQDGQRCNQSPLILWINPVDRVSRFWAETENLGFQRRSQIQSASPSVPLNSPPAWPLSRRKQSFPLS